MNSSRSFETVSTSTPRKQQPSGLQSAPATRLYLPALLSRLRDCAERRRESKTCGLPPPSETTCVAGVGALRLLATNRLSKKRSSSHESNRKIGERRVG